MPILYPPIRLGELSKMKLEMTPILALIYAPLCWFPLPWHKYKQLWLLFHSCSLVPVFTLAAQEMTICSNGKCKQFELWLGAQRQKVAKPCLKLLMCHSYYQTCILSIAVFFCSLISHLSFFVLCLHFKHIGAELSFVSFVHYPRGGSIPKHKDGGGGRRRKRRRKTSHISRGQDH